MTAHKRLGLIVNPIAGMGGRVGLKGTDRPETLARARELGATPLSPERANVALGIVAERLGDDLSVLAAPGPMGTDIARGMGLAVEVTGERAGEETMPSDTVRAAIEMAERGVDLLLFAGGDGTARDICGAIGHRIPALGI